MSKRESIESGTEADRRATLADLQRARIVRAVAEVVAERGVAGASIELVLERAHVSRRTLGNHFDDLAAALIAVLEEGYGSAVSLVTQALVEGRTWTEGMRLALAATLAFFDSEPALARVCLVEAQAGDPLVRAHLESRVRAFRSLVAAQFQDEVSSASPLVSEGALASVMGVVRARLISPEAGPLIELLGPLMGLIVDPFMTEAEVAAEVEAANALAQAVLAGHSLPDSVGLAHAGEALAQVPRALTHPSAFRLRECLQYIAAHPGASNSQVAAGVGIPHRGQTALLLRRLASLGLLAKRPGAAGHANAWQTTTTGDAAVRALTHECSHASGRP